MKGKYKKGDKVLVAYPDGNDEAVLTSNARKTYSLVKGLEIDLGYTYNTEEGGWCAEDWIIKLLK